MANLRELEGKVIGEGVEIEWMVRQWRVRKMVRQLGRVQKGDVREMRGLESRGRAIREETVERGVLRQTR
jgi:hypothetical protein